MIDKLDKQQLTVFFLVTNDWYVAPVGKTPETERLFSRFDFG